jgi:hypothetical protein
MKRIGSSNGSCSGRRIGKNESRRDMGCTFERVVGMEDSRVMGSRASSTVGETELVSHFEMLAYETVFIEAGKAVDVSHHAGRPMKDLEEIAKKAPGPNGGFGGWDRHIRESLLQRCSRRAKRIRIPKEIFDSG